MGNIFTKNRRDEQLRALENRLTNLEGVDRDEDGVVSHSEFELWKKQQEFDLESFKQKIIDEEKLKHEKVLIKKDVELKDLKKELKALKKINGALQKKKVEEIKTRIKDGFDEDKSSSIFAETDRKTNKLSEDQIRLFVDELLKDQDVNISVLPDWAERQIYINVFNILLGLVKKTVETSSIKFIGHEVGLNMRPSALPDSDEK